MAGALEVVVFPLAVGWFSLVRNSVGVAAEVLRHQVSASALEVVMPSVLGLLEVREVAARGRVDLLREEVLRAQAVLAQAEAVVERLVIAREEVTGVLAPPQHQGLQPSAAAVPPAVAGSVVPSWQPGLGPTVLAPDYQRLLSVLADQEAAGGRGMRCGELARAMDLEATPARVEGVRSRMKRLSERGWAREASPGVFSPAQALSGSLA
ncbi:hypothetical protein QMK19_37715 [Streptomyces sp. H10-C2]|uniref:hypothetical protein n=1 Tax=Streptomyces sp. H10-C2 TaxID=3046210 RepID=UPI0024B912D9|nr:hypothetical protein [Streptomyces sp. H10-C2]MDJ0375191.1 hypothetical protein [Streptomyces sp. H10-C2]